MTQLEECRSSHGRGSTPLRSRAVLKAMMELGGLQVVLALTGLVRNKVAAVYLSTAGMGEWAQILNVATTAFIIVQFGMIIGLSRNVAAAKNETDRQRQLSVANTLTMATALLISASAVAIFSVSSTNTVLRALCIPGRFKWLLVLFVFLMAPVEGLRNNFLSFLQGVLDIRGIATKRAIAVVLATVASIPLVAVFGVVGACLQFALGSLLMAVLLGHRCHQLGYRPLQFHWDRSSAMSLATLGGASLAVSFAYSWVDVLIRSRLIRYGGLSAAGIYQAAFLLSSQVTQIALGSIGVFSLASISRSTAPDAISRQLHTMYRVVLPVTAVGLGMMALLERPATQLLFSAQFVSSVALLPMLLAGNSVQAASWVAGAPLLACGMVRTWFKVQLLGALLRYAIVTTLIPVLGTQAIPLAFLLGQFFDLIASLILCSRNLKVTTSRADLVRIGVSSILPGILSALGLVCSPFAIAAGFLALAAGAVSLAPDQALRFALQAIDVASRYRLSPGSEVKR